MGVQVQENLDLCDFFRRIVYSCREKLLNRWYYYSLDVFYHDPTVFQIFFFWKSSLKLINSNDNWISDECSLTTSFITQFSFGKQIIKQKRHIVCKRRWVRSQTKPLLFTSNNKGCHWWNWCWLTYGLFQGRCLLAPWFPSGTSSCDNCCDPLGH